MKTKTKVTREEFAHTLRELGNRSVEVIVTEGLRIWDKLTQEERDKFATDTITQRGYAWRIARAAFCATGPAKLEQQWATEANKPAIRAIKRIDKSRMS